MESVELKVKYFSDEIEKLRFISGKSNWIDLRSAENVHLKKAEYRLIRLGVGIQLPEGYEAYIDPRSGRYKNFRIIQTNHWGIIDSSYCGDNDEWMMPVLAMEDTQIYINDRICQFRIIMRMQPEISFVEVDHLGKIDRGGCGSTGIR